MASRHREHLAGYLAARKPQSGTESRAESNRGAQNGSRDVPVLFTSSVRTQATPANTKSRATYLRARKPLHLPKGTGKAHVNDLPDELLLRIFNNLDIDDLLVASQVCARWNPVANDNSRWSGFYQKYGSKLRQEAGQNDLTYKQLCIKGSCGRRDKMCARVLKTINPFTGLPRDSEKALKSAGVYFQMSMTDQDDNEITFRSQDVFYHQMSASVRWFDLQMPAINSIKKLSFIAMHPLFYTNEGKAMANSPFQKSLLLSVKFDWQKWLKSNKPAGFDDMVNIYSLPDGLALATWKSDGGLGYVSLGLHCNLLVKRCLQGSTLSPYDTDVHKVTLDDIDSAYGLHDYQCTIDIRTLRNSIWSQQFNSLACKKESLESGFACLPLIRKDHHCDHVILQKKIQFPWKTDAFRGIVENVVWIDVVVLDERKEPFWCVSSLCRVSSEKNKNNFDFDYTSDDAYKMSFMDERGKLEALMSMTDDGLYFMTQLDLKLSLDAINKWFGTSYR
ncbi:F-box only protein 15-like [Mya arenaria]|uniref:F-box only protein 15-like n=1 Tax=Mya arenaria TaxID=6604 RepID=UPI0022E4A0A7|nr:F-box only protein 15-like [Mya arenaria]